MTDTYTFSEYDRFSHALNALHGFSYLINTAFDDQPSSRDRDGIVALLDRQLDTLDNVFAALLRERQAALKAEGNELAAKISSSLAEPSAEDMRARREENIRQIMRDVDYGVVAKAHGMDPVKLRAILYELMEAPQKAHPGAKTMDTMMPSPAELARMHGPIPEHFEREAIAERLTGGARGLDSNVS